MDVIQSLSAANPYKALQSNLGERLNDNNRNPSRVKEDQAEISAQGQEALDEEEAHHSSKKPSKASSDEQDNKGNLSSQNQLSTADQQLVQELQSRDKEVRQHEQAHKAAAGRYASGAISYEYERGPDGKQYAVGGHVGIDVGATNDPQQTIRKMDIVRRAALAPKNPSGQDRMVAAAAAQTKQQAILEYREETLKEEKAEQAQENKGEKSKVEDSDESSQSNNKQDNQQNDYPYGISLSA